MTVGQIFAKEVVTAGPGEPLAAVALLMEQHNVGTVVIAEDDKPIGMVTDRDLALALGTQGFPLPTPIRRVMSTPAAVIDQDQDVLTATQFMKNFEIRRLPIVDGGGRLIGIVTLDDLLRLLGRELYNLAEGIEGEMLVKGNGF